MEGMVRPYKAWWPYLEAVVLCLLIAFINSTLFQESPAFKGLPFSLLWVPILFISGRYGTAPAIFTALLCSGFYFYMVSLENFLLGTFEFNMNDKVMVFVFVFVAIFLGQMNDRLTNEMTEWKNRHDEVKTQYENALLHLEAYQQTNTELEKRIVGRYTTINSLYSMAKELETLDRENLFRGVLELTKKFLQAERACVFQKSDGGRIEIRETLGYTDADLPELRRKGQEHPMILKAFSTGTLISFRDGFAEQAKAPEPHRTYLVTPLFLPEQNRPVAVITIDQLPFLALNSANLRVLEIISDWAGRALDKLINFTDLKARELDDKLTGVYSWNYFKIRIGEELARAQRYELTVSLLMLQIVDYDKVNDVTREDLLSVLGLIFNGTIRDVDVPCRFQNPYTFAVILPLTDAVGIRVLERKIRETVESYGFKPYGDDRVLEIRIGSHSYTGTGWRNNSGKFTAEKIQEFVDRAESNLRTT